MYPPQPLETNVAAFVPEVLKPHFYRVLFLVGSEVEMPASNGQQRKQGSRRSPAKRVRWEEETQRNEQVFAAFGGNEGYGACADEKQDKGLASEPTLCPVTSARSAGS